MRLGTFDGTDADDAIDGGVDWHDLGHEGPVAQHGADDALARAQHHAHWTVEAVHPPGDGLLERWAHWR